jgi:hypothetical protein
MYRILAVLFLASIVGLPASAQHYDLYYVLPAEEGTTGMDAGLVSADIGSLGEVSNLNILGKYSISDNVEVGARGVFRVFNDGRNNLSTIEVGVKLGIEEMVALTAALLLPFGDADDFGRLLPAGDADDFGLSIGAMRTKETDSGLAINTWLQATFLKGYHADGVGLNLLIEPTRALGDRLTGYIDVLVNTETDSFGDNLGVNIGPNVDITLSENALINVGLTFGMVGDAKQDDIGLVVALVAGL